MSDPILCETEETECDSVVCEEIDIGSYAGEGEDDPDWTKERSNNTFDFPHDWSYHSIPNRAKTCLLHMQWTTCWLK